MQRNLKRYRIHLDRERARLASVTETCRAERASLASLDTKLKALSEAQTLTQYVASQVQNQAHKRIAEIVTKCLVIFDEPYTFKIYFDRKRGKTEARLVFERDGLEVDPLSASGGGVVAVASFALRVACLMLARPALRRVLVLDEPFCHASPEYRPRVKSLLETLAREMGIQFIVVTHDPQLRAGRVIELT